MGHALQFGEMAHKKYTLLLTVAVTVEQNYSDSCCTNTCVQSKTNVYMYALSATSNRSTENPLECVKSKRKVDTKHKNDKGTDNFGGEDP